MIRENLELLVFMLAYRDAAVNVRNQRLVFKRGIYIFSNYATNTNCYVLLCAFSMFNIFSTLRTNRGFKKCITVVRRLWIS